MLNLYVAFAGHIFVKVEALGLASAEEIATHELGQKPFCVMVAPRRALTKIMHCRNDKGPSPPVRISQIVEVT